MPIENRELAAGTRLVVRHKKQEHTCEVVQTGEGLRYRLESGKEFNSPSSAGREITNGVTVNGWRFWSLEGSLPERKAKPARTEKPAKTAKPEKPATKKAPAKKAGKGKGAKAAKKRAQRAVARGDSYGCGACGETSPTMKAATKHALTHTS